MSEETDFGRVGDDGTVYVRTSSGERVVGQWPDGDPAAALEFYRKRYDGLAVEVDLLEQRTKSGALSPEEAASTVAKVRTLVDEAQAVGDLEALTQRLDALQPVIAERREARKAERAAKIAEAKVAKEAVAVEAESLAQGTDWRNGANRLRELLDVWKGLPRIDKPTDDALWHRFSAARTTYTRRRKQHFAELNEKREGARVIKEKLVIEAEELSTSTEWGPTARAYRDLMSKWKAAGGCSQGCRRCALEAIPGRPGRVLQRPRRDQRQARRRVRSQRRGEEGLSWSKPRPCCPVTDSKTALDAFRVVAEKWDAAGKVPRADMKDLEGRFKKVEQTIRGAEDDRWRRSNPEAHARASATVAQLEASIASLEADLAKAETAGNEKKAADARAGIEARQSWLTEAQKALEEFSG